MVYLTGDTHRSFERIFNFCDENLLKEDDVLVILGDAGINFYLDGSDEDLKMELSLRIPCDLFCVHGNHEERPDMIDSYKEKEWHGGIVYVEPEYPNLIFAKDGEIYDFEGKKAVVIGGAYSIDRNVRLFNNLPWFDSEQPDDWIKEYVEKNLDAAMWRVDYVFSHTVPLKYLPTDELLPGLDQRLVDHSTEEWLDEIENRLSYDRWFAGHFHCSVQEGPVQILFEDYVDL